VLARLAIKTPEAAARASRLKHVLPPRPLGTLSLLEARPDMDVVFCAHTGLEETNRLVWGPDFFGCIAFLVSSHIAWMHLNGRFWRRDTDDAEWWSNFLPYVGSVLFMASAIASFTLTTTGEPVNIAIVNTGTFLGAICFLLAAYVTLPAATTNESN
jgi:hypothetical protein